MILENKTARAFNLLPLQNALEADLKNLVKSFQNTELNTPESKVFRPAAPL